MRVRKSADHFDLLPFIAILMCTLGTLLLVTLSMAALNLGPGAGETWIPSNDTNRTTKLPILFEWDGDAVVVHRETERLEIAIPIQRYIQSPDGSQEEKTLKEQIDAGLGRFRQEVLDDLERRRETHYALFAIRPSGFNTFGRIRSGFKERKIGIGTEPIEQGKPVKLAERKS